MEELDMEKKEQLYEGKAKKVYATEDPEKLIVSYKDDATAFNGLKKGTIYGSLSMFLCTITPILLLHCPNPHLPLLHFVIPTHLLH